jgi:hypothetical protein
LAKFAFAEPINANLVTTAGEIRFELFPDKAPLTVANFLKYFEGGHFAGGSYYRVVRMDNQEQNTVKIEVIQGGLGGGRKGLYRLIPLSWKGRIRRDSSIVMEHCLWLKASPTQGLRNFYLHR